MAKKKILGVTMGVSLQVFWRLAEYLSEEYSCALYVSDSRNFARAIAQFPDMALVPTLKEWAITEEARHATPDFSRLKTLQSELPYSLWHALLADRRVFFGPMTKARQDYRSRLSEQGMLALLDVATRRIDEFLAAEKPDLVLGFGTATFGDYLIEQLANRRGIPYGQLKATKINNNVAIFDTGIDIPRVLVSAFDNANPISDEMRKRISSYIDSALKRGVTYEGTILFGRSVMWNKLSRAPLQLLGALRQDLARFRDKVQRNDPHLTAALPTAWYTYVVHPLRTFRLGRRLDFLGLREIEQLGDFALYPMHFEPEVALQVFGRPFQNQIELVRTLAINLPVGMTLLVKEHPRSLGFRRESYYRKLLSIPNVRLVDPFIPAIDLTRQAKLVCVVSGSIGLEAAIVGKPVMVFGRTHYSILPETMVRQVKDPNLLDLEIRQLLRDYRYDRDAIERLIAALISVSVPINLYTKMFQKKDRYSDDAVGLTIEEEYRRLSDFLRERIPSLNSVSIPK